MSRLRIKPWMALAAVLLLLVVAFFGTFYIIGGSNNKAQSLAGSAVSPAVSTAGGLATSIRNFFDRLFAIRDVDKQYETLKARVQYLELANSQMQELQGENERLTKLLGFEETYPNYEYLPAEVIGKETGSWFIRFTLNRGSSQGVKNYMSVVNENGLIGTVVQVGENWCKVMAVIDRQSAVSVVVVRTRDTGMVHGAGDPGAADPVCDILHLPVDADIMPGDQLLTSDFGGIYLKGIPVGTVESVSRDDKLQRTAKLKPYVDFAHIENVLIVKSDKKVPTDDEINAEASASAKASSSPQASSSPEASESPEATASSEATGEP